MMAMAASSITTHTHLLPTTTGPSKLTNPRRHQHLNHQSSRVCSSLTIDLPRYGGQAKKPTSNQHQQHGLHIPDALAHLLHLNHDTHHTPTPTPTAAAVRPNTPAKSPKEDISDAWREIHGADDWVGLLGPQLHPWLRREVVKYGEFAQATYDAFDFDPSSPFCGSCLYGRPRLFDKLGLAGTGYEVTKYLYAMSHVELPRWLERPLLAGDDADTWSKDSNWMGFVAVSNDEETRRIGRRDVVVAWRGTVAPAEWFEDVQGRLEPVTGASGEVRVEHGFHSIYTSKSETTRYNKTSASEQVMAEVEHLVGMYRARGEEVSLTVTGHSLGGALALLNAHEAAGAITGLPVTVVSFGAPRVGNAAFGDELRRRGVRVLRVVNRQDLVPKLPGVLFNEKFPLKKTAPEWEWAYAHAGVEMEVDVRASPFLKRGGFDLAGFHSLETYLHLVDGCEGCGFQRFRAGARRDVALVNKACGMLRVELGVPDGWYRPANKGLVRNAFGRWVRPEREPEDIPSPYRQQRASPTPVQFA